MMRSTILPHATTKTNRSFTAASAPRSHFGEPFSVLGPAPGPRTAIQKFQPAHRASWVDYVSRHPEATFFHELTWRRAVERGFGHQDRSLVATEDGKLVGVLPLIQVESLIAGRLLISQPYATYGGALADSGELAISLLEAAARLSIEIQARSLEIRSLHAIQKTWNTSHGHVTFRGPLPEVPSAVDSFLPRKARAAARSAALKHSLTVEFGPHLLPEVWRLYSRSMRRLGSPNYPMQFFQALTDEAPDRVVAQIVRERGHPVASLLSLLHRQTFMPYFAGIDDRAGIYGLSHYLYAASMRWAVEHGYRTYDFGRTRVDNKGAFEFKRLCGFEPQPLEYQVHVRQGQTEPDLNAGSARWAAARGIWQKLPLAITRPLGGFVSRSIPG